MQGLSSKAGSAQVQQAASKLEEEGRVRAASAATAPAPAMRNAAAAAPPSYHSKLQAATGRS
jgi:hypothetical protein